MFKFSAINIHQACLLVGEAITFYTKPLAKLQGASVILHKRRLQNTRLLKKYTTVTGVWIAGRLHMGHRVNASRAVSAFEANADKEGHLIKAKMLQCTG